MSRDNTVTESRNIHRDLIAHTQERRDIVDHGATLDSQEVFHLLYPDGPGEGAQVMEFPGYDCEPSRWSPCGIPRCSKTEGPRPRA